jgi:hypothetical protein
MCWQEKSLLVLAATFANELSLLRVFINGAEPKKKRGRSAKPCLVVQFHPAPPLTHATAKATMATGPIRYTYYKQNGFEVWGKQYQDPAGAITWRLRVFSEQDRRITTYEDVAGDPPQGKRPGETEAMRDALAAWLAPAPDEPNPNGHLEEAETASLRTSELRLNEEERKSLPPRALAYIEYLEQENAKRS